MPHLHLHGLDETALAELKRRVVREGGSGNRLDDLDALAGSWSTGDAADFESAVAPFGEVDARLWPAAGQLLVEGEGR